MEQSCRGISESGGLGFIAAIGSTTVPQGGNEASRLCLGGCVTIPRSQECNFILNFWLNLYPVSKCKYHWFPLLISQGSCTLTRTTTSNLEGLAVILATTRLLEVQMLDNEPARLRSYVTEQYSQANPFEQTWSYVLLYSTKNEVGRRAANDVSRKRVALPLNVVRSERMSSYKTSTLDCSAQPCSWRRFLLFTLGHSSCSYTDHWLQSIWPLRAGDVGHYQAG